MGYSKHNTAFLRDKNQFFTQLRTVDEETQQKIEITDEQVKNKHYDFLLEYQKDFESEFAHMFAVLKKQKDKNNENDEEFWLYCYYCASILEAFYKDKAYSKQAKEAEYAKFKEQIRNRLLKVDKQEAEERFIEEMKKSFTDSFHKLVTSPLHVSQLRDYVGFTNLCRLYWIFCRLTVTNALSLAKNLQFIDNLDAIFGMHTDVDKIISVFQMPSEVLNYFSVGLFVLRFMIDAGLLIRHTFSPSEMEKDSTYWERFKYELFKRHCNYANDLVWGTVNFLTNFNQIAQIPGPIAGMLTAVFLAFDLGMILYKRHLAKQEYLTKRSQYLKETELLENGADENSRHLIILRKQLIELDKHHLAKKKYLAKRSQYLKEIELLEICAKENSRHLIILGKQLIELEIDWQTKEATLYYYAGAAAFLMCGFAASLIFTPPGIIIASYFICIFAAALYFSGDTYTKYKEKELRLEYATGKDIAISRKEYEAARNDFIFTLVKNTLIPSLLIATFAVCWPAAIALTVLYIGYEMYHSFDQHSSKQLVKKLALEAPEEDDSPENYGLVPR